MKITIVCVGKNKKGTPNDALREMQKKDTDTATVQKCRLVEVADERTGQGIEALENQIKEKETGCFPT